MEDFEVTNTTDLVDNQRAENELDGLPEFDPELFKPDTSEMEFEEKEAKERAFAFSNFQKTLPAPFYFPPAIQNGIRDAANAVKDLPIDIGTFAAQAVSGEAGDAQIEKSAQGLKDATSIPEVEMEDTTFNNVTRGLTQFFAPFGAVSKLNKASSATKLGSAGVAAVNGAITDFMAFDQSEKRLADLAEEMGLENPLARDEDDSALMSRFKTTLEGMGLGVAFEGFAKSVKVLQQVKRSKNLASQAGERAAKSRGKLKAAREAAEKLGDGRITQIDLPDFRPDKEVVDVATQRRMAEAVGTTVEQIKTGDAFKSFQTRKLMNKMNSYTLAEESAFDAFQDEAAEHAFRLQQGDVTARQDFVDGLFEVLEVHGKVQDATADIARAQGFRSQVGAVQQINAIRDIIARSKPDEVDDLIQAVGEAKTTEEIRAMMKAMRKTKVQDVSTLRELTERWFMNSILSSPVTLASDTISNVTFTAYNKLVEKPVAAAIGGLRAMRGGNADRVRLGESLIFFQSMIDDSLDAARLMARGYNQGGVRGAGSAVREGLESQRVENFTRFGARNRKAFLTEERLEEIPKVMQGPAQFMANTANSPTNFMQGKDDIVKGMLYRSAVRERSYRAALNEGLKPGSDEFIARVKDLQLSPLDNIADNLDGFTARGAQQFDQAVKELGAEEAALRFQIQELSVKESRKLTFTDPPSKVAEGVNLLADNIPGGRFIVPFVTTIDNLTRRALDRSFLALLSADTREVLRRGGAEADEAIARIATGTTLSLGAYGLALNGYVTGDGPSSKADRDSALQVGWRPRAFLINNKYIDFSRQLGPLALMFQAPANIAELSKMRDGELDGDIERDITEYTLLTAQAIGRTILSQSWARGIADLFEAVNGQDEAATQRTLDNLAASLVVPNAVSFVANEINPTLQAANGVWERIQVKVGAKVRPKHDVFGEPITRDKYLSVLSPAPMKDLEDVADWKRELFNARAFPNKPSKRISVGPVSGIELSSEQYERMLELVGTQGYAGGQTVKEFLAEFVGSDQWQALPSVEKVDGSGMSKREFVQAIYRHALEQARMQLIKEYPDLRERAVEKGLLERRTPGMSPMMQTINERIQDVRQPPTIQP